MAQKSKKIKNKPRPPPAPGSVREDPPQQDIAVEVAPVEDPAGQEDSTPGDPPSEDPPVEEQAAPSEKEDSPSGQENPTPADQLPFPGQQESPAGQLDSPTEQQNPTGQGTPSEQPLANSPPPPSAPTTDARPTGGRKGKADDDVTGKVGELAGTVPNAGLQIPGAPQQEDDKSSLKIKIHLNIHAKVRLELDAQIYGDVVIGLL